MPQVLLQAASISLTQKSESFATQRIHVGEVKDQFGSLHTPIYDTTAFWLDITAVMLDVIEGCRYRI